MDNDNAATVETVEVHLPDRILFVYFPEIPNVIFVQDGLLEIGRMP